MRTSQGSRSPGGTRVTRRMDERGRERPAADAANGHFMRVQQPPADGSGQRSFSRNEGVGSSSLPVGFQDSSRFGGDPGSPGGSQGYTYDAALSGAVA